MPYYNPIEVTVELFRSLLSRYENNLETSTKRGDFIFDSV